MSEINRLSADDQPSVKLILVVEDDADLGDFFVQVVRQETPYQSLLATDGFQALKIVRNIKPDLLVLDYQLPSMDGIELYDILHATKGFEEIPAVFISANAPTSELEKRRVYYIRKPFELEELLQTITDILTD